MRDRYGLECLVKYIALCDGKQVQEIWLDADAFKGITEEVAKSLDVSLNHIDTYQSDGYRTLLLGHTIDSCGGGVTDILVGELKNAGHICVFYRIVNCCMHAQSKAL